MGKNALLNTKIHYFTRQTLKKLKNVKKHKMYGEKMYEEKKGYECQLDFKTIKNYSKGCQLQFTTLGKGMPTRVHNARKVEKGMPT